MRGGVPSLAKSGSASGPGVAHCVEDGKAGPNENLQRFDFGVYGDQIVGDGGKINAGSDLIIARAAQDRDGAFRALLTTNKSASFEPIQYSRNA